MWWDGLLARVKYLLSFLKREWALSDYPVRVRRQAALDRPERMGQLQALPWIAQIVNWWSLIGMGDSREAALESLRQHFDEYKQIHRVTPRPGMRVPLELASTAKIDRYRVLARDFFDRILGMDFDTCFVSDQSSLWDFPDTAQAVDRIRAVYGVDVSDIEDGNLVRTVERLREAGHTGLG